MAMFGKTVEAVTEKFAYLLVDQAKKNINKKAPYAPKGIKRKDGKPSGASNKAYKINATGKLKNSIKYKMDDNGVGIYMEDYGVLRDAGQLGKKRKILSGWNKSIFTPRGKGFTASRPAVPPLVKWASAKGIKPSKGQTLVGFAIASSYSIWDRGIMPGLFMSTPFNNLYPKYLSDMDKALSDDFDILIEENID